MLCFRYLFNDAEVKPFDSAQLASECFGGEMTVGFTQKLQVVCDFYMLCSIIKSNGRITYLSFNCCD